MAEAQARLLVTTPEFVFLFCPEGDPLTLTPRSWVDVTAGGDTKTVEATLPSHVQKAEGSLSPQQQQQLQQQLQKQQQQTANSG